MATETLTYDALYAGNVAKVVRDYATITGGNYTRGTALGMITASGKLTIVDSSKTDGSENIYAILETPIVNASSADVVAEVSYTGEFNTNKLVFGGTDTAATHKVSARKIGLFFKTAISA